MAKLTSGFDIPGSMFDIAMEGSMPTLFQQRVYEAIGRIPKGQVTTYALLARHVRCGSARAVGQALRHNPFAPKVPCHRVIAADLRIGGFCGARDGTQIRRKRALLATEGVTFDAKGRLADPARVFRF